MNITRLALIISVSLVLSSCGKSLGEKILGKWEQPDGSIVEYLDDSTFIISEKSGPRSMTGSWVFLEDGRFESPPIH